MDVLKRCHYDPTKDRLICLGDFVDGSERVKDCLEYLSEQPNIEPIFGNHDKWFLDWVQTGEDPDPWWLYNGGPVTLKSYNYYAGNARSEQAKYECAMLRYCPDSRIPRKHVEFIRNARLYYETDNWVAMHGGFRPEVGFKKENPENIMWDRDLFYQHWQKLPKDHKLVIVGHTPTMAVTGIPEPIFRYKTFGKDKKLMLINIDTGGKIGSALCVLNPDTLEWWTSKKETNPKNW